MTETQVEQSTPHPTTQRTDDQARQAQESPRTSAMSSRPSLLARVHLWSQRSLDDMQEHFRNAVLPRTTTVSLQQDSIRVVVFRGKEVLAWGTTLLDSPPSSYQATTSDDDEVIKSLQLLLRALPSRRGRVVIDLPLSTTLLRHIEIPRVRGSYLRHIVLSEISDTIPFHLEETDVTWQSYQNGKGSRAFATIAPRQATDRYVGLLHKAGLFPKAIYARATALACAVGFSDALVLWRDTAVFVVVLVKGHLPFLAHQIVVPPGANNGHGDTDSLAAAVQQVDGYYQTFLADEDEPPLPTVLIDDDDGLVGEGIQQLQQALGREIRPFSPPPLGLPPHFSPAAFVANLGLMMTDSQRGTATFPGKRGPNPAFSLLPERQHGKPWKIYLSGVLSAFLLLASLAVPLTQRVDALSREADSLETRLVIREQQERQIKLMQGQILALDRQKSALEKQGATRAAHLAALEEGYGILLTQMKALVSDAGPFAIELSGLALQGDTFTILGLASSYENVLGYVAGLKESGLFTAIDLLRTEDLGNSKLAGSSSGEAQYNLNFQVKATSTAGVTPVQPGGHSKE